MQRTLARRFYYGWVVVGITALTLLVSGGVRSAPGVFIPPLEDDFGWRRAAISFGVSVGLLLFGAAAPLAGWLTDRFGPRRLMLAGLVLIVLSTVAGAAMTALWQFTLFWGVIGGVGTGVAGAVLGATVANRWFVARRGVVLGVFGAATSAGQLVFVPALMWLVDAVGWRGATLALTACAAALLLPVLLLMRDTPADVGLRPYGDVPAPRAAAPDQSDPGGWVMRRAVKSPDFWLLAATFGVCGATSNGLIGVHFIPHSLDHGIPKATAAGALAVMGGFNFVGTLASGWLTDRYDPRRLLACYYTFRGLSLFLLPFVTDFAGLTVFAVLFGLDYIATVPPTAALTADIFGRQHVGAVYGWIFFSHQIGAALAGYLGGVAHDVLGSYTVAFLAAGALGLLGGLLALRIDRAPFPRRPTVAAARV